MSLVHEGVIDAFFSSGDTPRCCGYLRFDYCARVTTADNLNILCTTSFTNFILSGPTF